MYGLARARGGPSPSSQCVVFIYELLSRLLLNLTSILVWFLRFGHRLRLHNRKIRGRRCATPQLHRTMIAEECAAPVWHHRGRRVYKNGCRNRNSYLFPRHHHHRPLTAYVTFVIWEAKEEVLNKKYTKCDSPWCVPMFIFLWNICSAHTFTTALVSSLFLIIYL